MFRRMKRLRAECRSLYLYHLMLHTALLCLALWKLCRGLWGHVGLSLLTLALCDVPSAVGEDALRLRVDAPLDIAVSVFAVCANVCGEISGFYLRFPWWDAMLHVVWGFLAGLLGCALLEAAQRSRLRPPAAVLAALGIAALSGILWEFFEFVMDSVFLWDMQKDAWLHSVKSVLLNPDGVNAAVLAVPESVVVDGVSWPGLLDPGLRDTMSDLLINFSGSLLSAAALLVRPRLKLIRGLMPAPFSNAKDESYEN
ncbi:MAG: hypothetical protein IKN89_06890 [Oscillospiraceae bacterium]|nr:hypothetical protein [Oscillospiraceae bacterium]